MILCIPAGTIKRIHVDRRVMAHNLKYHTSKPPITVQTSRGSVKAQRVDIQGHSRMVYPGKQLSCGARVWVETRAMLMVYADRKDGSGIYRDKAIP